MNKHHIDKDLKSIKLKLDEPQSNITTWKPPLSPLLSNDINAILKEFETFSRLPKILQDNLHLILDTCDTVEDVLELYEDGYIRFYPEYKSGYEFVKDLLEKNTSLPKEIRDCIDSDVYFDFFKTEHTIIETKDGIIIIDD